MSEFSSRTAKLKEWIVKDILETLDRTMPKDEIQFPKGSNPNDENHKEFETLRHKQYMPSSLSKAIDECYIYDQAGKLRLRESYDRLKELTSAVLLGVNKLDKENASGNYIILLNEIGHYIAEKYGWSRNLGHKFWDAETHYDNITDEYMAWMGCSDNKNHGEQDLHICIACWQEIGHPYLRSQCQWNASELISEVKRENEAKSKEREEDINAI